jgi:Nuclease-related domain
MSSETTKSAAKLNPLRQVAEAVDYLVNEVFGHKLLPWLLLPLVLVPYAVLEWLRFLLDSGSFPKTLSVIALAGLITAAIMIRRALTAADAADASQAGGRVEDALEALTGRGYHVFHAVPCGDFEVAHVAVGPTGIYTIEAQPLGKPKGRRARIVVDRNGLAVAGQPPSQEPLAHASAQAASLSEVLKALTGKTLRVRAVLLFPGWIVEQKCPRMTSDPWVLDTKAFLKMVERAQTLMNEEQIALASYQLWRVGESR